MMPLRIALLALFLTLMLPSGVLALESTPTPIVEEPCTRQAEDAPYICIDGDTDFVLALGNSLGYIWEHPHYRYFAEWAERSELDIWQSTDYSPTWSVLAHERAIYVGTSVSDDPLVRSMHLLHSMVFLWVVDTYGYCPATGFVAMMFAYLYGEDLGVDRGLLGFKWEGLESVNPREGVILPC